MVQVVWIFNYTKPFNIDHDWDIIDIVLVKY